LFSLIECFNSSNVNSSFEIQIQPFKFKRHHPQWILLSRNCKSKVVVHRWTVQLPQSKIVVHHHCATQIHTSIKTRIKHNYTCQCPQSISNFIIFIAIGIHMCSRSKFHHIRED
jgi:hypothetical protein